MFYIFHPIPLYPFEKLLSTRLRQAIDFFNAIWTLHEYKKVSNATLWIGPRTGWRTLLNSDRHYTVRGFQHIFVFFWGPLLGNTILRKYTFRVSFIRRRLILTICVQYNVTSPVYVPDKWMATRTMMDFHIPPLTPPPPYRSPVGLERKRHFRCPSDRLLNQ